MAGRPARARLRAEASHGNGMQSIRDAAVAVDRATRQLRLRDADEALRLWAALGDGRLVVVDEFERDGRRYLVARARHGARAQPPDAMLTPRQHEVAAYAALGHANKLIAYELGVSVSTVATHLMAASRKLRASSRAALIASMRVERAPPAAADQSRTR